MKMLPLLAIIGTIVVTGCTSTETKSASATPATSNSTSEYAPKTASAKSSDMKMATMPMSPMKVDGTTASYEQTATGAALHFRTSGDVAELRRRVDALAELHNKHHSGETMEGGGMMRDGSMPLSTASSLASEDGARLVLLPNDTADLQTLRNSVMEHARMMASSN